jgi:hypothetical protein
MLVSSCELTSIAEDFSRSSYYSQNSEFSGCSDVDASNQSSAVMSAPGWLQAGMAFAREEQRTSKRAIVAHILGNNGPHLGPRKVEHVLV